MVVFDDTLMPFIEQFLFRPYPLSRHPKSLPSSHLFPPSLSYRSLPDNQKEIKIIAEKTTGKENGQVSQKFVLAKSISKKTFVYGFG